jgi:hypothetical protein
MKLNLFRDSCKTDAMIVKARPHWQIHAICIMIYKLNKGNNKITELRTILQRESQNS